MSNKKMPYTGEAKQDLIDALVAITEQPSLDEQVALFDRFIEEIRVRALYMNDPVPRVSECIEWSKKEIQRHTES